MSSAPVAVVTGVTPGARPGRSGRHRGRRRSRWRPGPTRAHLRRRRRGRRGAAEGLLRGRCRHGSSASGAGLASGTDQAGGAGESGGSDGSGGAGGRQVGGGPRVRSGRRGGGQAGRGRRGGSAMRRLVVSVGPSRPSSPHRLPLPPRSGLGLSVTFGQVGNQSAVGSVEQGHPREVDPMETAPRPLDGERQLPNCRRPSSSPATAPASTRPGRSAPTAPSWSRAWSTPSLNRVDHGVWGGCSERERRRILKRAAPIERRSSAAGDQGSCGSGCRGSASSSSDLMPFLNSLWASPSERASFGSGPAEEHEDDDEHDQQPGARGSRGSRYQPGSGVGHQAREAPGVLECVVNVSEGRDAATLASLAAAAGG